jgi:endonuclease III-like uncharacterized protein
MLIRQYHAKNIRKTSREKKNRRAQIVQHGKDSCQKQNESNNTKTITETSGKKCKMQSQNILKDV